MRNIKNLFYSIVICGVLIILFGSCNKDEDEENDDNSYPSTVTDIEGNVYNTVKIGTQVWMNENLRTTKYRDGSEISHVTNNYEWSSQTSGAYCNYNESNSSSKNFIYSRLYNWYAVSDSRNIAPEGWHVPTEADWATLTNYLIANGYNCGSPASFDIAKSLASTTEWESSTGEGDVGNIDYPTYRNKTGFTAIPCGYRDYDAYYRSIGQYGGWWATTTAGQTDQADNLNIRYNSGSVSDYKVNKNKGLSVRCLMD